MNPRIVIVGGGQAAGWAAKTLRDEGFGGELHIVADEPWDFYERPPLSKAALLTATPALPRLFSEQVQSALRLIWHRPQCAEALLRAERIVVLSNGERLPYDQLLLATGGRARLPQGLWQSHPQIYTLRHWQDAIRLKTRLDKSQRLAIVGGGWIGLEIAAAARQRGIDVTVFEQQPRVCQRSVSPTVSVELARLHRAQGVTLHCDCGPLTLTDDHGLPTVGWQAQRQVFDTVVVGIGVELNLALARQAGLSLANGVVVDGEGRTSDPAIFAAGDIAQHPRYGLCVQSWAFAQNQAIHTARAMLGLAQPPYDEVPWLWSDQYQHNIQILGVLGTATQWIERRTPTSALFFALNPDGTLAQLVAFNDARTIKLAKRWMACARVLADVPLADPAFSLMSLR